MQVIKSYTQLKEKTAGLEKAYLLLYKKGAEQSDCAFRNLAEALLENEDVNAFVADTNQVRDIHPKFNITSAPALLVFENGEYKNTVKGCHHPGFFNALFENAYVAVAADPDKPAKSVTVYSTPSCSWCNTLKTHLRKNGIRFSDIDVSRDQSAAEEMVRRSGQQGVPQTDIDGEIIVGFDKNRINTLLGIQ
ncbi:MAG: glutaredoxin domain-containing protein [Bacteroidales bacterium]|nr:glutaredoxin domain-containing protein [Bacteroidales bacterium]